MGLLEGLLGPNTVRIKGKRAPKWIKIYLAKQN